MTIKITDKILSIPPYISAKWSQIVAVHMKGDVLAVTLTDGDVLHIPNLHSDLVHLVFHYHAMYLERGQAVVEARPGDLTQLKRLMEQDESSIGLAFGTSFDGVTNIVQHNPSQSNAPDLPPEIVAKIGAIAKIISPAEDLMTKAETGCNCFYCQIARVFHPGTEVVVEEETEVKPEELLFQQWSITQTGEDLFSVENRLDLAEKYNVFLGEPVGCTCGKAGCEHILAVLKS